MKYSVGIDFGGTNISVGVVDENCNIIARHTTPTIAEKGFEGVVSDIAMAVKQAVANAGLQMEQLEKIGMGSPSCINPANGLLVHATNLGWHNVPLYSELEKYFSRPVIIKNDADCAALGEVWAGAAQGYDDAIMVTLGTGVGGGIIINKRIFDGYDHMGSEIGHTTFVSGGEMCNCGRRGCLEAYASATALIRQTRQAMDANPQSTMWAECGSDTKNINGQTAFNAALAGDPAAKAVIEQYVEYVAGGIASLIAIFRPQVIIVGGGISAQGNSLLQMLNESLAKNIFTYPEIGGAHAVLAKLGNDAGIIGASRLSIEDRQI